MYRSEKQTEFAQRVAAHLNSPDAPLLLEGATGLGKTRAYLHPLFASEKRVAICLATNELITQLENSSDLDWVRSLFPDKSVATFRSKRSFCDEDGILDREAYRAQKETASSADVLICTSSSVIYDQRLGGVYNGVTARDVILFDEADLIPSLAALSSDLSIDRQTLKDLNINPTTASEVAALLLERDNLEVETTAKARIISEIASEPEVWYKRVGMTDEGGVAVIHRLPGRLLKKIANRPTTIFVSATLSVNGTFKDFRRSMGITEVSSLSDILQPDHHGTVYFSFAVDHPVKTEEWISMVVDEIEGSDGLTLVVTPSHELAEQLGGLVSNAVWRTRGETTREAYERLGDKQVLIAAGAWAGLDVPRQWDTIIVPRVPFSAPRELFDQWDEELAEHLRIGDPMTSYLDSKNTASRRMVQVLGRGLRHPDAKVNFVICDSRIGQLGDIMPKRFHTGFFEGRSMERNISVSERNPAVRREALRIRGTACEACGHAPVVTLREVEVHHRKPIADAGPVKTNVNTDVYVLCRICHVRAHKKGNEVLRELDELKGIAEEKRNDEFQPL